MKWAIFLGSTTVGGGTYVIFEHATRAVERGIDVTIITRQNVSKEYHYDPNVRYYAAKNRR